MSRKSNCNNKQQQQQSGTENETGSRTSASSPRYCRSGAARTNVRSRLKGREISATTTTALSSLDRIRTFWCTAVVGTAACVRARLQRLGDVAAASSVQPPEISHQFLLLLFSVCCLLFPPPQYISPPLPYSASLRDRSFFTRCASIEP